MSVTSLISKPGGQPLKRETAGNRCTCLYVRLLLLQDMRKVRYQCFLLLALGCCCLQRPPQLFNLRLTLPHVLRQLSGLSFALLHNAAASAVVAPCQTGSLETVASCCRRAF